MSTEAAARPPQLEIDGAVATLTLCRPAQANRIEPDDLGVLFAHIETVRRSTGVRALILTGTGRHFSAGFDLGSILDVVPADPDEPIDLPFGRMVDALEALPQLTVAAINGGVFGGATDLALACDFRYGVPTTRMFVPPARLGLQYHLSGLRRFVSRCGLDAAKRLLLLAQEIDATEMVEIGYLQAVVPADALMATAHETAKRAAAMAPLALSGMKATLNAIAEGTVDEAAVGLAEQRTLRSADLREGVAAWREKREPRFSGN